jgi:DNA polymerase-1
MLINVLRDEDPTHVGGGLRRLPDLPAEEYAEYKAGRSATPSEFSGQISLLQEVLDALRIPIVEVEGYEADDVIATLTTQARSRGWTSSSAPATGTPSSSSIGHRCSTRSAGSPRCGG